MNISADGKELHLRIWSVLWSLWNGELNVILWGGNKLRKDCFSSLFSLLSWRSHHLHPPWLTHEIKGFPAATKPNAENGLSNMKSTEDEWHHPWALYGRKGRKKKHCLNSGNSNLTCSPLLLLNKNKTHTFLLLNKNRVTQIIQPVLAISVSYQRHIRLAKGCICESTLHSTRTCSVMYPL